MEAEKYNAEPVTSFVFVTQEIFNDINVIQPAIQQVEHYCWYYQPHEFLAYNTLRHP
jgi:hypothetical protein